MRRALALLVLSLPAAALAVPFGPPAAPAAPRDPAKLVAPEKPRPHPWSGSAGAGLILLTGNTDTLTVNGSAAVEWESRRWLLGARATGVYGRNRAVDAAQPIRTVALGGGGRLRADLKLSPHLTVFSLAGAETDHPASVELRSYGDLGAGVVWLDRHGEGVGHALFVRTDLGARYAYETRWQYYATDERPSTGNLPDVQLVAPRLGATVRLGGSDALALVEEGEVLANVLGAERYTARSLTKLTTRVVGRLTLGWSYLFAWDSRPAPGKVPTDTTLSFIAELTF